MGRREDIVRERTLARRTVGIVPSPKSTSLAAPMMQGTTIDLGRAPYTVPCPVCNANACAPCRIIRKGAKRPTLLVRPHPHRWRMWEEHPERRVVPGQTRY